MTILGVAVVALAFFVACVAVVSVFLWVSERRAVKKSEKRS
jgi:hypothetical protein